MKKLIIIIFTFTFSLAALSQCDTVTLTVMRIKTAADGKLVIWMKDKKAKQKYITQCDCAKVKKVNVGDEIKRCRADLQIIRERFTRKDLEN